jgi:hypothetical protein
VNAAGFIKQALPWIGAAASGNIPALVSLAASTVAKVTGGKVEASTDSISAAIAGATPEQLLALKTADNELAEKMQQMGFAHIEDLEKIAADDRASARAREITLKDRIPALLAIGITLGFFGLLALMIFHSMPQPSEKIIDIMVGSLGAAWLSVVTYYFGSSAAHDAMTETRPVPHT